MFFGTEIAEDTRGTSFEVTLSVMADAAVIVIGGGGISYCVRDREQGLWCTYVGAYAGLDVDPFPIDGSLPADEEGRWTSFESVSPARVTDFGGRIATWSAGISTPLELTPGSYGVGGLFLAHVLFPYAAPPLDSERRSGLIEEHGLHLPTGPGLQLGAALAYGLATPARSGRDSEGGPWAGYYYGVAATRPTGSGG